MYRLLQIVQVTTDCTGYYRLYSYYRFYRFLKIEQVTTDCAGYFRLNRLLQIVQVTTDCTGFYRLFRLLRILQVTTDCTGYCRLYRLLQLIPIILLPSLNNTLFYWFFMNIISINASPPYRALEWGVGQYRNFHCKLIV